MYIELSHYLLMLAVFLAFNLKHSKMVWMMSLYFILVTLAFFTAIACYMCSDFSISNLFTNSNANTPLFFQIAATWSNHEGSLLLWCWLLSVYGFWFCYLVQPWNSSLHSLQHEVSYVRKLRPKAWAVRGCEKERPLRIQAFFIYVYILIFFHAFLLITSNPFLKIPFLCVNSVAELNPVLQDPILAIHPPCIYAGYVASAIGFSICLSKCIQAAAAPLKQTNGRMGRFSVSAAYVNLVSTKTAPFWTEMWTQIRVWILTCWCFLTIGILLGSWWAYHELGWGGWWFWDPVENASLMPWLLATACIHSVLVPRLNGWTLCLNQFTFVLSVLGTFFVRSGLLASVHSFATDSTRGLFLLCFLVSLVAVSVMYLGFYSSVKSGMKPIDVHKLKHYLRSQGVSAANPLRVIEPFYTGLGHASFRVFVRNRCASVRYPEGPAETRVETVCFSRLCLSSGSRGSCGRKVWPVHTRVKSGPTLLVQRTQSLASPHKKSLAMRLSPLDKQSREKHTVSTLRACPLPGGHTRKPSPVRIRQSLAMVCLSSRGSGRRRICYQQTRRRK